MFDLKKVVRPNILRLKPYSTARDEAGGAVGIEVFLDANESPYGEFNRYPDPHQLKLKELVAERAGVEPSMVFIGNGSDEAIDLMYRIFCVPGRDNAVAIAPTYGMYAVAADINDIAYLPVQLNPDFSLPVDRLLAAVDADTRLMWVCSPNNPTGNAFPMAELRRLAENFDGILVVDEAYIHFAPDTTGGAALLASCPNVVLLRTFSKAHGLAAARVGIALASPEIVELMDRVKYPYNVNALSQRIAYNALAIDARQTAERIATLIAERDRLAWSLAGIDTITTVFPSDANFLLVKVADGNADRLYGYLRDRGVLVRNRSTVRGCEGSLRLTVGTPDENDRMIELIRQFRP